MDKANARPKKAPTTINNLVDIILCCIVLSIYHYIILHAVNIEVIEERSVLVSCLLHRFVLIIGHTPIVGE